MGGVNVRSTSWINLRRIQLEFLNTVNSHRRKGFVDFENVNVILTQPVLAKKLRDRKRWPDPHDPGREADCCCADEAREDGLAEVLGGGAFHKENRGGWSTGI